MREIHQYLQGMLSLLLATASLDAAVLSGPVTNAANGHVYYLLSEDTWTASEAEAETLGGTLAVVNDQEENDWIYSTFSVFGDTPRGLWIGLTDQDQEGTFVWVTGDPLIYTNWGDSEPNNAAGEPPGEDYGHILWPGEPRESTWNDLPDTSGYGGVPLSGVVEVVPMAVALTISATDSDSITLSWNGGPGIKLQKTSSLTDPEWQDVAGSDGVSSMNLPMPGSSAFFRLVKP